MDYLEILELTKKIKQNIMLELADKALLYGGLPEDSKIELEALQKLDNIILNVLKGKNIPDLNIEEETDFAHIHYKEKTYSILRLKKEEVENAYKRISFEDSFVEETPETMSFHNEAEDIAEEETDILDAEEDVIDIEDIENIDELQNETTEVPETSNTYISEENATVSIEETVEEKIEEAPPVVETLRGKATVIGGNPSISKLNKKSIFIEETSIKKNALCFTNVDMSVIFNGRDDGKVLFTIAPLSMMQGLNVPIVVAMTYKGNTVIASSYDSKEEGKNIVHIANGDLEVMCRGSITEDGKFKPSISTVGISSNMYRLTENRIKQYNPDSSVKNGHIKFKVETDEGPGTIEIIPMDMDEDAYLFIQRNEEFIDYNIFGSVHPYCRLKSMKIYDDGKPYELVCAWDSDFLESERIPK